MKDRVRTLYRWLLAAYPRQFRAEYESDLMQAFDDRRGEPRFQGVLGGIRLSAFLFRDFARSLPLLRGPRREEKRLERIMGDVIRDLQYSVRMLVKNPLFTIAAIATLALGIGLNAATFSAVYGILLRPLGGTEAPEP